MTSPKKIMKKVSSKIMDIAPSVKVELTLPPEEDPDDDLPEELFDPNVTSEQLRLALENRLAGKRKKKRGKFGGGAGDSQFLHDDQDKGGRAAWDKDGDGHLDLEELELFVKAGMPWNAKIFISASACFVTAAGTYTAIALADGETIPRGLVPLASALAALAGAFCAYECMWICCALSCGLRAQIDIDGTAEVQSGLPRWVRPHFHRRMHMITKKHNADHPAHCDHPDLKGHLKAFYTKGDVVDVFDPTRPHAHPHSEWLRATVIEQRGGPGGDVGVRFWDRAGDTARIDQMNKDSEVQYAADEEWVGCSDCRLVRRAGSEGDVAALGDAPPLPRRDEETPVENFEPPAGGSSSDDGESDAEFREAGGVFI
jgi:hypothetical protein